MERKSKQRQKKEAIVAELTDKVQKAQSLVFANYQGLTHPQLEQLKKKLKAMNAELVVTKNTLLKRALEGSDFGFRISDFGFPTATLFIYGDAISALKELAKTIKTLKLPTIKFGIIEGRMLVEHDVIRLSTLPTRDILLAQLVGQMQSPLYGLHRALQWHVQKLVMVLKGGVYGKTDKR